MVYDPQRDQPRQRRSAEGTPVVDSLLDPLGEQLPPASEVSRRANNAPNDAQQPIAATNREPNSGLGRIWHRRPPSAVWAFAVAAAAMTLVLVRIFGRNRKRSQN